MATQHLRQYVVTFTSPIKSSNRKDEEKRKRKQKKTHQKCNAEKRDLKCFIRAVHSFDADKQQVENVPDFPPEYDASNGVDENEYSGEDKVESFSQPSGTFDDLQHRAEVELEDVAQEAEEDAGREGDQQAVKFHHRRVDVGKTRLWIQMF